MKLSTCVGVLALAVVATGFTSQTWANARVTVGHFAPFASSLQGTSVSIRVNGQTALSNVVFGQFTEYLTLGPAGSYTLEVIPTGTTTVAISATVSLANNTDYTVLAVGDGRNQPLALLPLTDDNAAPPAGQIKLRVVHAAPFANTLPATEVSIRDNANNVVGGLARVPFRGASPYLTVPAGTYDLRVATPDGSTTLIDPKPVNLAAGRIVTLVATGGANGFPTGVTAITAGASPVNPLPQFEIGQSRVRVAHFAPFANTLAGTAVSVRVNGNQILENVRFRQFSGELTLSQGAYQIQIFPQGSSTAAISGTVEIDGNRAYTLAAVGDGSNQPLGLRRFEDRTSTPPAGRYALRIAHLAPFAASSAATEVSIRTDDGSVVANLSRVPYDAASGYLELPVGTLDVKVSNPDGTVNFIDLAPLNLPAGAIATAYAVGDGRNQPLGIVAVPVGDVPLEDSVDGSANGLWFNPQTSGQGLTFFAIPRENRLIGTWYTFLNDGSGRHLWYTLDSCRVAVAGGPCTNPGGFDNRRAQLSIYETVGGNFNAPGNVQTRDVGSAEIRFLSCTEAEFSYRLGTALVGPFRLTNLVPNNNCGIENP